MKAIILAAGRGSRMGALTDDRPKGLTKLGGLTLIERAIQSLRGGGCTSIGIATGYRAELVTHLGDHAFHNAAWAKTNMVMTLAASRDWLTAEPVIISYSDIFYSAQTVAMLSRATAPISIAYDPHWLALWSHRFADPLSDAETFKRASDGYLVEIGHRPGSVADVEGQYMGLIKMTPCGWAEVEAAMRGLSRDRLDRLDMTSLLSLLLDHGVKIATVAQCGQWGECDSAADLALYEGWISQGRLDL
jgi:choline kinase